jgi:hypothetical protein
MPRYQIDHREKGHPDEGTTQPPTPRIHLVEGYHRGAEERGFNGDRSTCRKSESRVGHGIPGFSANHGHVWDSGGRLRTLGEGQQEMGWMFLRQDRHGFQQDRQVAGDLAAAAAGTQRDKRAIDRKPMAMKEVRALKAGPHQLSQGVADVDSIYAPLPEELFLKRKDAVQLAYVSSDLGDAALAPGPGLGGDEIKDGYVKVVEASGHPKVEIGAVGKYCKVRFLGAGGRNQSAVFAVDAGDVPENFDNADDRKAFGADDRFDEGAAHVWTGATEEVGGGEVAAEGFDKSRGIAIARSFAGGNENFGGRGHVISVASREEKGGARVV